MRNSESAFGGSALRSDVEWRGFPISNFQLPSEERPSGLNRVRFEIAIVAQVLSWQTFTRFPIGFVWYWRFFARLATPLWPMARIERRGQKPTLITSRARGGEGAGERSRVFGSMTRPARLLVPQFGTAQEQWHTSRSRPCHPASDGDRGLGE